MLCRCRRQEKPLPYREVTASPLGAAAASHVTVMLLFPPTPATFVGAFGTGDSPPSPTSQLLGLSVKTDRAAA